MLWSHKLAWGLTLMGALFGGPAVSTADDETWDGKIVQYGKMHEAIGQQQHQGRVQLKRLVERPHFFGVGALENLDGEATIRDGEITVTRVGADGSLSPVEDGADHSQATLLVGAYVPAWTEHRVAKDVGPGSFDEYVAEAAKQVGIKTSDPFVFAIEGEYTAVRLHVIHGACPMHARLKNTTLPAEKRPFEVEMKEVQGTLVGIFASDAVGDITHPATSTHMHLLFEDPDTGRIVTGHVEQLGLQAGAVLRLPKVK